MKRLKNERLEDEHIEGALHERRGSFGHRSACKIVLQLSSLGNLEKYIPLLSIVKRRGRWDKLQSVFLSTITKT
jgi:hypothetical protein